MLRFLFLAASLSLMVMMFALAVHREKGRFVGPERSDQVQTWQELKK